MDQDQPGERTLNWGRGLDLLQTLAILAGILFGVAELTQFRADQARQMQLELARSLNTPEVMQALSIVLDMDETLPAEDIDERISEHEADVLFLSQTLETIGILVYEEDLEIGVVDEFFGSMIIAVWARLQPWAEWQRVEVGQDHFLEWLQWLAERLTEYRDTTATPPAYDAFSDWTPSR